MIQERRTRDKVRGGQDPTRHVAESGDTGFPLDGKARLPHKVAEGVRFISGNAPKLSKFFRRKQLEARRRKAREGQRETDR